MSVIWCKILDFSDLPLIKIRNVWTLSIWSYRFDVNAPVIPPTDTDMDNDYGGGGGDDFSDNEDGNDGGENTTILIQRY